MSKRFSVRTEALTDVARKLEYISGNYSRIAQDLFEKVKTMGLAWESPDNIAFVQRVSEFENDVSFMVEKLREAASILEKQSNNYRMQSEENISTVKRLPDSAHQFSGFYF